MSVYFFLINASLPIIIISFTNYIYKYAFVHFAQLSIMQRVSNHCHYCMTIQQSGDFSNRHYYYYDFYFYYQKYQQYKPIRTFTHQDQTSRLMECLNCIFSVESTCPLQTHQLNTIMPFIEFVNQNFCYLIVSFIKLHQDFFSFYSSLTQFQTVDLHIYFDLPSTYCVTRLIFVYLYARYDQNKDKSYYVHDLISKLVHRVFG